MQRSFDDIRRAKGFQPEVGELLYESTNRGNVAAELVNVRQVLTEEGVRFNIYSYCWYSVEGYSPYGTSENLTLVEAFKKLAELK